MPTKNRFMQDIDNVDILLSRFWWQLILLTTNESVAHWSIGLR